MDFDNLEETVRRIAAMPWYTASWRGAAAQVRQVVQGLSNQYLQGIWVIRPALLNCLLTCLGGVLANLLYDGWYQDGWTSLARRFCVGYLGAVLIVLLVLPWLGRQAPAR